MILPVLVLKRSYQNTTVNLIPLDKIDFRVAENSPKSGNPTASYRHRIIKNGANNQDLPHRFVYVYQLIKPI